mmetsp:Transcript_76760/g.126602  ORF Transcript_76760/g.126602 Transcript_76760/m.126602 type:complete len:224 (-) Transcript_76760:1570-2241(-)
MQRKIFSLQNALHGRENLHHLTLHRAPLVGRTHARQKALAAQVATHAATGEGYAAACNVCRNLQHLREIHVTPVSAVTARMSQPDDSIEELCKGVIGGFIPCHSTDAFDHPIAPVVEAGLHTAGERHVQRSAQILQPGVDGGILSKDFGRQTVPLVYLWHLLRTHITRKLGQRLRCFRGGRRLGRRFGHGGGDLGEGALVAFAELLLHQSATSIGQGRSNVFS